MHYFELELQMTERQHKIRQRSLGVLRQVWRSSHGYAMSVLVWVVSAA
ncbi:MULTISPECIES: hypothetical protein [Paenibacillus]|nr:hypothetical protein [Paenibacillus caseinilyticus]MCZ8522473.1 hypothetical protein [Paenibacillus caseinilyticus]